MSRVVKANDMTLDDLVPFNSRLELASHLVEHPNTTGIGVAFDISSSNNNNNNLVYTILHNSTVFQDPMDPYYVKDMIPDNTIALQMSIDNAIRMYMKHKVLVLMVY